MTFEITDKELLKITTDFEYDARYHHLLEGDYVLTRLELKQALQAASNRVRLIKDKMVE